MTEIHESSVNISVIIPCYNDADHIGNAIESILSQTTPPNEIVVVDDGSSDDTKELVTGYDEVTYLRHETNKGAAAARNTGVERSGGGFIAFLDADDEWVPTKLERQLKVFRTSPELGMVYTGFYAISSNGDVRQVVSPMEAGERFVERLFVSGGSILPSSALVRRECFEAVGGFNEELEMGHDRELWLRIGTESSVARLDQPLLRRQVRPDSLASNYEKKYECAQMTTEKMVERYPELEWLVDKREANLRYNRASYYLEAGEATKARKDAIASFRLDYRRYDAVVICILSFFEDKFASRGWSSVKRVRSKVADR